VAFSRLVSTADTSDVLAALALAVALGSLVAAVVSARASLRSAKSAQDVADTEAARLRQERAPKFEVAVFADYGSGHYTAKVKNVSRVKSAYCAVEINTRTVEGLAKFTGSGGMRSLKQLGSLEVGEVIEAPFVAHDTARVDLKFSVLDEWRGRTSDARGEWIDPPNLSNAQVYVEHVDLPTRDSRRYNTGDA